jgi:hypothetical protein
MLLRSSAAARLTHYLCPPLPSLRTPLCVLAWTLARPRTCFAFPAPFCRPAVFVYHVCLLAFSMCECLLWHRTAAAPRSQELLVCIHVRTSCMPRVCVGPRQACGARSCCCPSPLFCILCTSVAVSVCCEGLAFLPRPCKCCSNGHAVTECRPPTPARLSACARIDPPPSLLVAV